MKSKKTYFSNFEGKRLAARIDLPEDERPEAYALFAHCFTCTKNLLAAANIARALNQLRIAVLRFDFTGLGESEGDFPETDFSSNIRDIIAAANFLEENFEAPRILIGHSLGGAAVLQAAADIPSAGGVAVIGAPCRPDHVTRLLGDSQEEIERKGRSTVSIGGRDFTITRDFLEDLRVQKPIAALRDLKAALLVLHSPRDRIVPIENAADIYKAARHPKSFISLDPADHLLSAREDSHYAGTMIGAWAGRFLDRPKVREEMYRPADNRVTARTGREGFRTDIFANGFPLTADEPPSFGGTGSGPTPYEYLLAALGSCTGMTIQMYARRKGWALESAMVRLSHRKIHAKDCEDCETKSAKIDRFDRELELQGDLDDSQRERLLEIAEKCPVHRTLMEEVVIETRLRKD